MTVSKVTISLPRELVLELDSLASAEGLSRSALVREAASSYVATRRDAEGAERRRRSTDDALETLALLRERPGRTGRTAVELLRELRGGDATGREGTDE